MGYLKENANTYAGAWFKPRDTENKDIGQIHIKMVYAESSDIIITGKKTSMDGLLLETEKMAPSQLAPIFKKMGPAIAQLGNYLGKLSPPPLPQLA